MTEVDVFSALSNPVRREILVRLRAGPRAANELARGFHIRRPAVSEHLQVLRKAHLVREEPGGRGRPPQRSWESSRPARTLRPRPPRTLGPRGPRPPPRAHPGGFRSRLTDEPPGLRGDEAGLAPRAGAAREPARRVTLSAAAA